MTYTVVAVGIVNAGKSSLLSALADRPELFEAGDVPGVTHVAQREPSGALALVDTPGLDAAPDEAALAMQTIGLADTVLWCHSLRAGELRPTELAALRSYPRRLLWRTCFVLTHRDEFDEADVSVVSKVIARQLQTVFGLPFAGVGATCAVAPGARAPRPFDLVGVPSYWRARSGRGGARAVLESRSGVPRLRRFLDSLAARARERVG